MELAFKNYEGLPAVQPNPDEPEKFTGTETPDPLAFALGWIVANTIVQRRYRKHGIDVIPVYHPENGWDRFLITRRVTSPMFKREPANKYGMIMLDGEDAPRLTTPGGKTIVSLREKLREDPVKALQSVLRRIPREEMPEGKHGSRWEIRRKQYPRQYRALTELIAEHPGMVVAREIFVDDQPVDGVYHPLYLHGAALEPQILYDWMMVQYGRWAAFFRTHGGQSVYETERQTWSTVKKQLNEEEDYEGVKRRIRGFMRFDMDQLAEERKRLPPKERKKRPKKGASKKKSTEGASTEPADVSASGDVTSSEASQSNEPATNGEVEENKS